MAKHNRLGILGEEIAKKFLMKRGFAILDRNYQRPWGELDIVSEYKGILHFVEVKSVSCDLLDLYVSDGTPKGDSARDKDVYRPEDNLHRNKIARLKRIIQTYLIQRRVSDETRWEFDIATIFIDEQKKKARVNFIEDIVLD